MPFRALPLEATRVTDAFWTGWQEQMARRGLPHQWRQCVETGRLENLRRVARNESGGYQGLRFNDSDIYKLLEATSYATALGMGDHLTSQLGEAVDLIAAAQQPDGYINSYVHLTCPEMRWRSVNALHEMYCIGHLIESAVAHKQATGKARLLDVAKRAAEHVMDRFPLSGPPMYPGHQEIELALVRLAAVTGESRYADYARWQVASRGTRPSPYEAELSDPEVVALSPGVKPLFIKDGNYDGAYAQDDLPLANQTRAVGHAVRAMYYYSAATDLLASDDQTMAALRAIWDNLTQRQMYVTGGIGSSGRNEGFTDDYDLPNLDAYAETCAGIGLVFWAWRMFLATTDFKYVDVLERALYNAVLSGVSESCDRYFYDNPLESDGRHERQPWFSCACCPPNIARLIMSIGAYAVAEDSGTVAVALPIAGTYTTSVCCLTIGANAPWDSDFEIKVEEVNGLKELRVRRPDSVDELEAKVNGQTVDCQSGIARDWQSGDVVTVRCVSNARWLAADQRVLSSAGRVALQSGPLVYCLEQHDLGAPPQLWSRDASSRPTQGKGRTLTVGGSLDSTSGEPLYGDRERVQRRPQSASFVPYYTWENRGPNAMLVWVRTGA